jgi:peptidoglycan/LPS O-acetylase OafA/YrhL
MLTPATPPRRPDDHFRPDIEGLRGVAVLLVVLFHAGLVAVPGGFIGVDVFFIISGFLITGLLVREHERNGRIDLGAFYARRIRRLAPAAFLVLVTILPVSYLVLDPLTRGEVLLDGSAAALSVSNLRFAAEASDYFAPASAPSPVLHFWSLSVEEQFYLVWPALLIAGMLLGSRFRLRRGGAIVLVALVFVGSFAASLALTETSPGAAFYLLPTRAWELAAGALLALLPAVAVTRSRPAVAGAAVVGWLGLLAIAAAAIALDGSVAYPGLAALLPAAGAVALIAGGRARVGPGRLLEAPPLRFLGRISYALYLWHWPLLVLGAAALGPLTPAGAAGLVGLALLLATASTFLVEEPIRRGLPAPTRRALSLGLSAILIVAVVATSLSVVSAAELDRLSGSATVSTTDDDRLEDEPAIAELSPKPVAAIAEPLPAASHAAPESPPTAPPTAPPTREPKPSPKPARAAQLIVAQDRGPSRLTDAYSPSLRGIREDEERLKADRCIAWEPETEPRACDYGNGPLTVVLVGDSHASHWFPALHAVAKRRDWTVVPFIKVACPFIDMAVHNRALKREYRECAAYNEAVLSRLEKLRPDLTIVALNHWVTPHEEADAKLSRIGAALGRQVDRVPGQVAILVDSPHSDDDVPTCLSKNIGRHERCVTPYAQAFSDHAVIEKAGAKAAGVHLIDLGPAVCSEDPCPDVLDGLVVYRDYHHFTATFSKSLAPALDRALRAVLP